MQYLWNITIDDYINVVKLAQKAGLKPADSMENVFLQYMKEKGQTHSGATELNKNELIKEITSKGKNVLDVETNKEKTNFKIYKSTIDKEE